jgi:hypothetical protein
VSVGARTNKVVALVYYSKRCSKCEKGKPHPVNLCTNPDKYAKSSKAMESFGAVETYLKFGLIVTMLMYLRLLQMRTQLPGPSCCTPWQISSTREECQKRSAGMNRRNQYCGYKPNNEIVVGKTKFEQRTGR